MATGRQEWLRSLILVPAWASVAIGVAGFPGNYAFIQNGKPDVFLGPGYSSVLLLCGAILLAGRFRPAYSATAGAASTVLLLAAYAFAWLHGVEFGNSFPILVVMSVMVLIGACASVLLGRTPVIVPFRDRRSVLIAAGGVFLTVSISMAVVERDYFLTQQYTRATADDAAQKISTSVSHLTALIQRMGERWSVIDGGVSERLLEREFSTYLRDYSTLGKIDVMLTDGTVLASRERLGHAEAWLSPAVNPQVFHEWLAAVAAGREARLAPFHRQKPDGL